MKITSIHTSFSDRKGSFGGKAQSLFALHDAGFPVPVFAVIPAELTQSWLPENLRNGESSAETKKFIDSFVVPQSVIDEILAGFNNVKLFAVRSSAIGEDAAGQSFAGQYESHLFVTPAQLEEKIKLVWKSAFSERIAEYKKFHGIKNQTGIAIIVQEMINANCAGVGFGINPVSGSRKEKVISAVYGVGEGLVSGELDADNYVVRDGKVNTQIIRKKEKFILDEKSGNGTLRVAVEEIFQNERTLSDQHVLQIAQWLDRLKKLNGKPQDIEFAFTDNKIFLLQSRPITTLDKLPDPDAEYIVWDNSNIIESYPGITSPLTYSFIRKMYEAVYIQFSAIMGIEEKARAEHAETYANMLGHLNGRVYYNLLSWYKLLALLPGYSLNAGFMEKMMGVKERFELKDYQPRTKFRERMRVLKMVQLMLSNFRGLSKMRRTFTRDFESVMQKFDAIDFSKCEAWELMRLYREFEQTLLKKWKAPLVNDFFAMIFYGTLQKLVTKYQLDPKGNLHNDLLCGARDIVSTEPVHRCKKIADLVKTNGEAKALFENSADETVWENLCAGKFPEVKKEMDRYISDWGDRTVGELKLETITYRQEPKLLVRVIKGFLSQTESEVKDVDMKLRREAETVVRKKLSGKIFKKWMFGYVLRHARDLVSGRENLRYARTRGFGMVRRIFIALGENFYAEGILENPRDIFWLKKEEIFDFIEGNSETKKFSKLIALRKNEFAEFAKLNMPERIATNGIVNHANDFLKTSSPAVQLDGELKGIGCCPGRVKARVRVVHDPHTVSSLDGDILVTASTDPGWVTLFPSASAILVERGSLLSHSAIVSREMGKPCIVGITGLLQRLKSGDVVEMDGSSGEIKICEQ